MCPFLNASYWIRTDLGLSLFSAWNAWAISFVKMAAIEEGRVYKASGVYLTCIFPPLYSFRPRRKDKKTGKMNFERGCGFRHLGRKCLGKSNEQSTGLVAFKRICTLDFHSINLVSFN